LSFDDRVTPARPDLAAKHLEGQVEAARFVEGTPQEVIEPQAPLRQTPLPDAPLLTEALMGERVTIYETTVEGWAWGQLEADHYVGWLPANALAAPRMAPTHRVAALRTLVFPGPSIKLPPIASLPFGACVAVMRNQDMFAVTAAGGYVPVQHLAAVDSTESDFVAIAERFVGTPYLWGGKTSLGLDCSGLVQVALTACGIACPRDTDMQEHALGEALAPTADFSNLRRGDLVFWQGHVAIARDATTLLHASASHMAVAIEPIADAISRIRATGSNVSGVRRLALAQA
jgi:cell wall-associated NlpC family hydrolase